MIGDYIESMIHEAQRTGSHIVFDDKNDNSVDSILSSMAKDKLLSYGLIFKDDKGRWLLNKRGLNFKSFEDENRKEALIEEKFAIDIANAKRIYKSYPLTRIAAWIGAISGIILLIQKLIEWYSKMH